MTHAITIGRVIVNAVLVGFFPALVVSLAVDGEYVAAAEVAGIFIASMAVVTAIDKCIVKPIVRKITMSLISKGWRFGDGVLLPPRRRLTLTP